jgi:hypothetical protein
MTQPLCDFWSYILKTEVVSTKIWNMLVIVLASKHEPRIRMPKRYFKISSLANSVHIVAKMKSLQLY